ncbi:hypothetical protein C8A01DRAFT_35056 [Parachaetomium inaequale]|uniref:Vacuolar ATPase assembly protein VMA22 n=1 Tax=Parachaetomium inaequale TaxID=2588326 RepID=A0AAN6PH35_9PEZI|nr:hypothetical protein C8A01DRAFT_35056 [Parachaetomium inaequale]
MSSPLPPPTKVTQPQPQPRPQPQTEQIDALLQHYLALLDEYTTLRAYLTALQTALFQDLARANFSAERGVRHYGRDYYDERMQAGRRVRVISSMGEGGGEAEGEAEGEGEGGGGLPVFTVGVYPPPGQGGQGQGIGGEEKEKPDSEGGEAVDGDGDGDDGHEDEKHPEQEGPAAPDDDADDADEDVKKIPNPKPKPKSADPLRWFGILTPLPLRQAQGHAIKAVEDIIPRLATLNAEMAGVELEVRRARKRRAKVERAEEKRVADLEEKMGKVDVGA